ncbi:FAD:protein FMN transferase [Nocardioides jensenii]|uniref:FAD:protein FMN transferase n=1 Tax=Nocardioides jensenii TaxID=1843 RepID=UPI000832A35B|nr:FAD:protein FMN transferase [Nocardioides jensenii]
MRQVELVSTMGTVVSLDVRTPADPDSLATAVDAVTHRLHEIDDSFSAWRPESWVSRLISGVLVPEDCPAEVQRLVQIATRLVALTDGYFSPFWRRPAYGDPGPDPTGLVKGWAAQQASDILILHGLPDHVVNAAGDLVVSGRSAPESPVAPWRIGISDPHRTRAVAGVIELDRSSTRWAVATSGTAELGAHVSDPHTGRFPVSVASATAVARLDLVEDGGAIADACATALAAAGEHAPSLVERFVAMDVDAFLISDTGFVSDPGHWLRSA